jgi:hypothetical protein
VVRELSFMAQRIQSAHEKRQGKYAGARECRAVLLATSLGLSEVIKDIQFERKFETGVPPRSPNIDVVLTLEGGSILAIESKYTKWHGTAGKEPLRGTYFPKNEKR